ncbi:MULTISPECIES: DUF732 domain-containing protein [unclassified Mycobacterium]|uniref:DUF732 domain-containing protein n=1 Tax=unclassified Mycobacterium TaxID=2642494 RepID=UPI0029C6B75A|nr:MULTISPECIES: DUF732 domain-containing protein [unclassified Mycobacterium]
MFRFGVFASGPALLCAPSVAAPHANADVMTYLVNVTVRPGDDFTSADDALGYGQRICDKVRQGLNYSTIIDQAVDELCPAQIWQLRNSAAHYRGG